MISHAGRIRTPAATFAWSTGSLPNVRGKPLHSNMIGHREKFTAVPFFWSQHYDVPISYVGHAENWDEIAIEGDIAAKDCILRFIRDTRIVAIASIFRDRENLQAELPWRARAELHQYNRSAVLAPFQE